MESYEDQNTWHNYGNIMENTWHNYEKITQLTTQLSWGRTEIDRQTNKKDLPFIVRGLLYYHENNQVFDFPFPLKPFGTDYHGYFR